MASVKGEDWDQFGKPLKPIPIWLQQRIKSLRRLGPKARDPNSLNAATKTHDAIETMTRGLGPAAPTAGGSVSI